MLYIYVQNDFTDVISNPVIYDTSNISLTTADHGLHIHVQTHIVDIIFVLFIILFQTILDVHFVHLSFDENMNEDAKTSVSVLIKT